MRNHTRARSRLLAIACVCGALAGAPLLTGPASAAARANGDGTGGAGFGGGSRSGHSGVIDVNVTVSASGAGMKLFTTEGATAGSRLRYRGSARATDRGRWIALQSTPMGRRAWRTVARARINSRRAFAGSWRAPASGRFLLRAVLLRVRGSASAAHTGSVGVMIFKRDRATWYGPGFWGNKTACGLTLKRTTLGVANRTLPCGTKVAINYRDRVIVVPVIDRGPYGPGANWDLTEATAKKIGLPWTVNVGTIVFGR